MLLGEIQDKLNDSDAHVRQDAMIALADFGTHAQGAVPVLLNRLRSSESTIHDRTLSAWALPRIGVTTEQALLFGDNYSFSSCCLNWECYQREWDVG
jgi:hypothetical protein